MLQKKIVEVFPLFLNECALARVAGLARAGTAHCRSVSLLQPRVLDGLELRLDVLHLTADTVDFLVNPSKLEADAQVWRRQRAHGGRYVVSVQWRCVCTEESRGAPVFCCGCGGDVHMERFTGGVLARCCRTSRRGESEEGA